MYLSEYELSVLNGKLIKGQGKAKKRIFTLDEIKILIEKIEKITTEIVKEYNYKLIKIYLRKGEYSRGKEYVGTTITAKLTKEGYVDFDNISISREEYHDNINRIYVNLKELDYKKIEKLKAKYNIRNGIIEL